VAARIGFATEQGWTGPEAVAIVDTGAPLSLFPHWIWRNIQRKILATVMAGGVAAKPECKFSADLAIIECMITDGIARLGPYRIHALLAHNDKVPALLGLSGAIEQLDLSVMLSRNSAYLESP